MAFGSRARDFDGPHPAGEEWPQGQARHEHGENALALSDTLRELAVTIVGFVAVIVLIITAVRYFHG